VLISDGGALRGYLTYLTDLLDSVRGALHDGATLAETLAALPLDEIYLAPEDSPLGPTRPFMQGFHLWNVKKTWLELRAEAPLD